MALHVARFGDLEVPGHLATDQVPLEAMDVLFARRLMPVVSPEGMAGPLAGAAPIRVGDFTMMIAECPPGQGPCLHAHHRTTETFTCLEGRFRVFHGPDGEEETILEPLDTILFPPGAWRGFQNVGTDDARLQVVITGGIHDMDDITYAPEAAERLAALGPEVLAYFEAMGLRAGDPASAQPPA